MSVETAIKEIPKDNLLTVNPDSYKLDWMKLYRFR